MPQKNVAQYYFIRIYYKNSDKYSTFKLFQVFRNPLSSKSICNIAKIYFLNYLYSLHSFKTYPNILVIYKIIFVCNFFLKHFQYLLDISF